MASQILGRTACPISCGHDAAHVKIKTDKATKAHPYVHCRGCGCQLHTKTDEQAAHLLKRTRPEALDAPVPAPTPTPRQVETPVSAPPAPVPPAPQARRFGFGSRA